MSQCAYRLEDTLHPTYCPNDAHPGMGGFCPDHELENEASPLRCRARIEPGAPGNEAGTTDVRCKGRVLALVGSGDRCAAHQPA